MKNQLYFLIALLCGSTFASAAEPLSFNDDIRPILSENCYFCHGPDPANRKADLRLDDRQTALDYLAIVPGKPDESELVARVEETDADLIMPPPHAKRTLTVEEKHLLREWIAQGAEFEQHWSFKPIQSPPVPEVAKRERVHNPIDAFIQQKLQEKKLTLSPPADRATLIRRLSFDLTGLPPTLAEIDAYLQDESPDATEKVIDRLLASPAYGERMTSEWLDVARYSDTYGYQVDRDRYVWPWRDWVIRAFNRNLSYDEFITEQIAGDLLPNASDEQILATTFNRLHPQKVEGGSVPEEFRIEYVADRTQTVGTAFLGLTMECCRCHTHKYDPITHTEYYQFSAFFDNIDEAGLYSYFTPSVPTPTLMLSTDAQKQQLLEMESEIIKAEKHLEHLANQSEDGYRNWLNDNSTSVDPTPAEPASQEQQQSEKAEKKTEVPPHPLIPGRIALLDFEEFSSGANKAVPGPQGQAVQLSGDDAINLSVGNFNRAQPFTVSLWMNTPDVKERAVVFHRSRAWTDAGSRGYQLLIEEGKLSASLIHFWPGNAIRVKTKAQIPVNSWQHVTVTYDGSSSANGLKIWIDGKQAECEVVRDELSKQITGGGGDNLAIGERFRDRGFTNGKVDHFEVYQRELTAVEIAILLNSSRADHPDSKEYYLHTVDPAYQAALKELEQKRTVRNQLLDKIPEIMVMREKQKRTPSYRLDRGAYDARAEQVNPGTPAVLPAFSETYSQNRLGLARWLTADENPLTARVAVNRYWQMMFGQGLVRTPEDFGSQGSPPTHPQLLDWLADDFRTHGWDLKRLLKQIAMSATYQQSSQITQKLLQADPENKWLARQSSFRLPAEMLRDQALAASGLLVDKIGGGPVKPYEVEASFKPSARSKGEGLYRRSLYTYWKRTGPAPMMMTLDASKRDVCRVKREKTTSPLQAFVMMNGPQFVEAARALASRILKENEDETTQLTNLFRTLTSRPPSPQEQQVIEELFTAQLTIFKNHPEQAKEYLTVGDSTADTTQDPARLAALTSVANTLLNFDETMRKR